MNIDDLNKQRRQELARFLRKTRARAKPEFVGIEIGARRRTAGLRREEVASLAGVSSIWYTWLEQGRDVQASSKLLGELAIALQLTSSERKYLHHLGRIIRPGAAEPAGCRPDLLQLLSVFPVPGLLADHRWQVIGVSACAEAFLPDDGMEPGQVNVMQIIFQSEEIRKIVLDWPGLALAAVSAFHMSYARNIEDIELNNFIAKLRSESVEFAEMWDEQIVDENPKCVNLIRHWQAGIMRFEFATLRTSESRELMLFSMIPADSDTVEAWELLRDGSANHKTANHRSASHDSASRRSASHNGFTLSEAACAS